MTALIFTGPVPLHSILSQRMEYVVPCVFQGRHVTYSAGAPLSFCSGRNISLNRLTVGEGGVIMLI